MNCGIDISSQRIDDLDRSVIRNCISEPFEKQHICNIGCGSSRLSVALASIGHAVHNYDKQDLSDFFDSYADSHLDMSFACMDIANLKKHHLPPSCCAIVIQRCIHYVSYAQAADFLRTVTSVLVSGGRIYISASGIDSALGQNYSDAQTDIQHRWSTLDDAVAATFDIAQPVCLYSHDELVALVCTIDSLQIEHSWVSQFGNIKIIAVKT